MDFQTTRTSRQGAVSFTSIASKLAPAMDCVQTCNQVGCLTAGSLVQDERRQAVQILRA